MKQVIVVLLAILLLLASSGLALAAPPSPKAKVNRGEEAARVNIPEHAAGAKAQEKATRVNPGLAKRQAVAGTVANRVADGFDVVTKQGSVHVKVDADTSYQVKGKESAGLADVANGARVNVNGTRVGTDLLAKRVHVVPALGSVGHAVGQVVAYSAGSSITVKDRKSGQNRTFALNAETRANLPDGKSTVEVNDWVTVVAKSLDAGGTPIAMAIAVHGREGS